MKNQYNNEMDVIHNRRSSAVVLVLIFILGTIATFIVRDSSPAFKNRLRPFPVFGKILEQREAVSLRSKLIFLNYVIPAFGTMKTLLDNPSAPANGDLKPYFTYYNTILESFPDMPEAYGVLGYLSYRAGNHLAALQYYQKAFILAPRFFWYPYDMAVILKQHGLPKEAAILFQQALNTDPVQTAMTTLQSKIYQQIIISCEPETDLKISLQENYAKAAAALKGEPVSLHPRLF